MAVPVMFIAMGMFGMGNGSVFQLVPLRFPKEIGVLTGIAGAAGGAGGFFLNIILGNFKQWTDSYSWGFLVFSASAFFCAGAIIYLGRAWIPQPEADPQPAHETELTPSLAEAQSPA